MSLLYLSIGSQHQTVSLLEDMTGSDAICMCSIFVVVGGTGCMYIYVLMYV